MLKGNKKDYVTASQNYQDVEGMKTFTVIDHDVKTRISADIPVTDKESKERREWLVKHYEENILEVLAMPAVALVKHGDRFESLVIRDIEKGVIWNEKKVRETMSDPYMNYVVNMLTWKGTVKEINWFDDMREDHEAILRGDWTTLM